MNKVWNFIKRIFSRKPPPPDYVTPVMNMIRAAMDAGNSQKLNAIFSRLNDGATKTVMDNLDPIERQLLLALLRK